MFSFSFAELFVDGKGWGVNISPWSYARFQFASHESLVKVRDCVIPGFRERSSSWVKSVFFGWVERCGLLVGQKKENGQQQPIMFPWLPVCQTSFLTLTYPGGYTIFPTMKPEEFVYFDHLIEMNGNSIDFGGMADGIDRE